MKVAFLTTDNRDQDGTYLQPVPRFGTAMSALLKGFEAFPGEVEVHVISCSKKPSPSPTMLAANIRFHQLVVPKVLWGRSAFLGCAISVRRLLRKLRPDLVHAQGTERDCGVSMGLSPWPRLLTIHGHMNRIAEITGASFPSYYWLASRLETFAIRRADGVICLSDYTRSRVESKAARTWVVPNAVDPEFYKVRPSSNTKRIALCIAHVSPWKRQVELISALDELAEENRPLVRFAGNCPDNEYGQTFRGMLTSRPWCEHVGNLGRDQLRSELGGASMLVLPSIEENCPMAILEAMAAGVPVAAAATGGVPDLIDPDRTGLLFDPRSPLEIRECVGRLAGDASLRKRLSANARQEAFERFHPDAVARQHLDLYRVLLTASGSRVR